MDGHAARRRRYRARRAFVWLIRLRAASAGNAKENADLVEPQRRRSLHRLHLRTRPHAVAGRLNDAAMVSGDGEIDDSRGDVL
jgi:hypothetical protein